MRAGGPQARAPLRGRVSTQGYLLSVGPAFGDPETCEVNMVFSCPFNPDILLLSETPVSGGGTLPGLPAIADGRLALFVLALLLAGTVLILRHGWRRQTP